MAITPPSDTDPELPTTKDWALGATTLVALLVAGAATYYLISTLVDGQARAVLFVPFTALLWYWGVLGAWRGTVWGKKTAAVSAPAPLLFDQQAQ